ncbi:MAG TPA: alanine-tRNA synthetase second additional domain-containing protein [Candidatus Aminicenantes bacterium]|nr:alanine-tRNA synthetase second additional domain-containing protein [Candidatus Aminicenantes bacterium]HRY65627.1 alanine-tRNA synthetase second additional domain-containing protein [Candidatus Aminicenantes bacterium]HRZ72485.1 alanine-tRNA synthetase second additional domain-containing protein [Candidatus Aminicenantes bacterium]
MIKSRPGAAHRETLLYAAYYAPRGSYRLYLVAAELAQKYLTPTDLLIGILGAEGSGKSTLIKGLFPGLELTNDDEGINVRPTPLYDFDPADPFSGHTFHVDVRYELAFHQKYEVAEAVLKAIAHNRRVVVEHFDLIYEALGHNAQVLVGIGEEIIVARPTVFGPFPQVIKSIVDKTIKYRLMAHSAEDITTMVLQEDYKIPFPPLHSDVPQGFVLNFTERPAVDLHELEKKVRAIIAKDVPISPCGDNTISIGAETMPCTGTRTHVSSSGKIENFRLIKEYRYDQISKEYYVIGLVGKRGEEAFEDLIDVEGNYE